MKLCWILVSACASVVAESGIFYNPPTGGPIHEYQNDPVYTLGQTVQMRWATTLESLSIMLWQNNNPNYEWVQTDLQDVTSYDWIVSTNRNLSKGEVFFFQIRNASNLDDFNGLFASHYFNITEDSSSTSTTSSLTTTTTQALASTLSLSPSSTQAAATTTSASHTSQENSGLSEGAKIGVGVGVGLGGSFIAALALFFFLRRRSKKRTQVNEIRPVTSQSQTAMDSKSYNGQPQNEAPKIFEAPANEARRIELE